MKLSEIATKLACRLEAPDPNAEILSVTGIDHALPGQLTFIANKRYIPLLKTTQATAVLIDEKTPIPNRAENLPPLAALRTTNPYLAFAHAIELFYDSPKYAPGVHETAVIARTARVPEGAHIGPYCFIDGDTLEGVVPNDLLGLLDNGLHITPPDLNSPTDRIFVPRPALSELTVLGVVGVARRKPAPAPTTQPRLFTD
jgi:UDP-3-O-[3-hydroxymyristoyl] glucosamine N-acyltransferase, LpxD